MFSFPYLCLLVFSTFLDDCFQYSTLPLYISCVLYEYSTIAPFWSMIGDGQSAANDRGHVVTLQQAVGQRSSVCGSQDRSTRWRWNWSKRRLFSRTQVAYVLSFCKKSKSDGTCNVRCLGVRFPLTARWWRPAAATCHSASPIVLRRQRCTKLSLRMMYVAICSHLF